MSEIIFKSDVDCKLIDYMGDDFAVIRSMLVSTRSILVNEQVEPESVKGRINFLMKNRHGTPFEHGSLTFVISTPIFVIRELHRHRIGFSYNEESGRYKELDPVFYVPSPDRNLVQTGKPGAYNFEPGNEWQQKVVAGHITEASRKSYGFYQSMLKEGIAKEVARMVLPVNIYSSQYVTCNPRSLMSFLSLRQQHDDARYPSKPMKEINMLADKMETYFAALYPVTHAAYVANGRVAP